MFLYHILSILNHYENTCSIHQFLFSVVPHLIKTSRLPTVARHTPYRKKSSYKQGNINKASFLLMHSRRINSRYYILTHYKKLNNPNILHSPQDLHIELGKKYLIKKYLSLRAAYINRTCYFLWILNFGNW